jgi:hypothetical protein
MDPSGFDTLTRTITQTGTRCRALATLVGVRPYARIITTTFVDNAELINVYLDDDDCWEE